MCRPDNFPSLSLNDGLVNALADAWVLADIGAPPLPMPVFLLVVGWMRAGGRGGPQAAAAPVI